MDINITNKWVSIEYAAEYLDVSQDTIRNWIKKGLTPIKEKDLSKSNLFDIKETIKWVEENINKIDKETLNG